MRIAITCVDLAATVPVGGVALTCTVKVAPRVSELVPIPDDGPAGPVPVAAVDDDDGGGGGGGGGSGSTVRIIVLESQAVVLPPQAR